MDYSQFFKDYKEFQMTIDYVKECLNNNNVLSYGYSLQSVDFDRMTPEGIKLSFEYYRCGDYDYWNYFVPEKYFHWYAEESYQAINADIIARDKAEKQAKADAEENARLEKERKDKEHLIALEKLEHQRYLKLKEKYDKMPF